MAKLLLYCTKSKIRLFFDKLKEIFTLGKIPSNNDLNGKIVAECDFEVDSIVMQKGVDDKIYGNNGFMGYGVISKNHSFSWYDENKTCLSEEELFKYLEGFKKPYLIPSNYKCKNCYAIHIKNLNIFDTPRELSDYYTFDGKCEDINNWRPIKKAPQNMMYAYEYIANFGCIEIIYINLNKNILISIRPEWLVKILNGEKTIEVRKKVLKEML